WQGVRAASGSSRAYGRYVRELVHPGRLDVQSGGVEDAPQLDDLAGVAGRQTHPGHSAVGLSPVRIGRAMASASFCSRVRLLQPTAARTSSASSSARWNGAPSAVPCTSMNSPSQVHTTFMSVSAI